MDFWPRTMASRRLRALKLRCLVPFWLSTLLLGFGDSTQAQLRPVGGVGQSTSPPSETSIELDSAAAPKTSVGTDIGNRLQVIAKLLEQIQQDSERPVESKESLAKLLQQASSDFAAATSAEQQRIDWNARIAAAPTELEAARKKREEASSRGTISDSLDFMSFEEVQAKVQGLNSQLAIATDQKNRIAEQISFREKRRKDLPPIISDLKGKLDSNGRDSEQRYDEC